MSRHVRILNDELAALLCQVGRRHQAAIIERGTQSSEANSVMEVPSLRTFRIKRVLLRWIPRSRLARTAAYVVGLDLLLYGVEQLLAAATASAANSLSFWVNFLTFLGGVLWAVVLFRWIRQRLLWRLRNRLIVTYVFMAVIPIMLLLAMVAAAGYMFAGQFATFVVTADIRSELSSLQASNATLANALAPYAPKGGSFLASQLEKLKAGDPQWSKRDVAIWYRGDQRATGRPLSTPPTFANSRFADVVRDGGNIYLRAVNTAQVGSEKLTVLSSEPLGKDLLDKIAGELGEISFYAEGVDLSEQGINVSAGSGRPSGQSRRPAERSTIRAGSPPPSSGYFDRLVSFPTVLWVVDWKTGQKGSAAAFLVTTRNSVLYRELFSTLGQYSGAAAIILGILGALFAVIELFALLIGVRLTRTITRSIAALYKATQHINRGDFSHRISVQTHDQLAALENSFNSMTESLQKLLAEQKEKQRMENELVIAQEVQSQLFPKQVSELESLEVHGFCRPARTVSGDYYDFVPLPPERLMLAVGDVSGKGISAALLMATIHSAVRAYSQEAPPRLSMPRAVGADVHSGRSSPHSAEVSPAALITLLNQQLYRTTPAEKYATLFLGAYDSPSQRLTYTNAGHLPPLIVGRDGQVRRLDRGGTVVGLFEALDYEESSIDLRTGDIFLAFSDGVTEPENDFGEFGEERLLELVRDYRDQPLARISETVLAAVMDWIGGEEQPDDVTLVLARAR